MIPKVLTFSKWNQWPDHLETNLLDIVRLCIRFSLYKITCHGGKVLMLPGSSNNKQVQITIYMLLVTQQQTPLTCWHEKTCLPQRTEWTMYITQYQNLYSYHFTHITSKLIVSKLNLTKLSRIYKQCTRWQMWEATGYGRAIWIH
jgi:hypothetical protein